MTRGFEVIKLACVITGNGDCVFIENPSDAKIQRVIDNWRRMGGDQMPHGVGCHVVNDVEMRRLDYNRIVRTERWRLLKEGLGQR